MKTHDQWITFYGYQTVHTSSWSFDQFMNSKSSMKNNNNQQQQQQQQWPQYDTAKRRYLQFGEQSEFSFDKNYYYYYEVNKERIIIIHGPLDYKTENIYFPYN